MMYGGGMVNAHNRLAQIGDQRSSRLVKSKLVNSETRSDHLLMSHLEDGHLIYKLGGSVITSSAHSTTEHGSQVSKETSSFTAQ